MLNFLDRLLGNETETFAGPQTIAPKPGTYLYGNDQAIDVLELSADAFFVELCHLIVREAVDSPLRSDYEAMLKSLHHWQEITLRAAAVN